MDGCRGLEKTMNTARLFQSDRSQAIRLSREFRFSGSEVGMYRFGNGALLLPGYVERGERSSLSTNKTWLPIPNALPLL